MNSFLFNRPKVCLFAVFFLLILSFHPIKALAISSIHPLFEQALQASKAGEFAEALSMWNQFLEFSPENSAALSNRGNVRLALGDPDGAIEDQTLAMTLLPEESDPHLNRGIAEESLRLWKNAEADYEWILERNPGDSLALYNLGNVSGSKGNWSKAEDLFSKASLARPDFALARASKALVAYQLGEFEQSEGELRMLIRKYPMLADARAGLTALLWRQGSLGEAESNWAAVAGLDSRYRDKQWLLEIRRWPPQPIDDLMSFLSLQSL